MAAESMSLRDMLFWFFITLFGTGTYVIYRSQGEGGEVLGITMIIVGLAGMVGCAWPQLRDPLTGKVGLTWGTLQRAIHNPLYRTAARRLIFVYLALYAVLYVHSLRSDLGTYVLPRSITQKQSDDLKVYLSHYEPHAITVKVNPLDAEAREYGAQLFNALKRTEWDATFSTANADPNTLNDGLCIGVVGQSGGLPDPKHDPQQLIAEALRAAHIESTCGSGIGAGDYRLFLLVGHRPMTIGDQEPTIRKFGRWIEELGQ